MAPLVVVLAARAVACFLPRGQLVLAPAAVASVLVAQLVPVAFAARQPVARRALVGA